VCSESTDDPRAGGLGERPDELAADDQRLLVGERQVDPLPQRRHGRPETGRADQRVEDEVRIGFDDQPDEALRSAEDPSVRPGLARPGRRVGVGEGDPPDTVRTGLLDELPPRALGREADDL